MKKKPRFFCDHCGYEVGSEIKTCPHCGRYFASVRCPECGYSGPDEMFGNGCPMCGYSAPPPPSAGKNHHIKPASNNGAPSDKISFWTYLAVAITLLAIISFFSYFITR